MLRPNHKKDNELLKSIRNEKPFSWIVSTFWECFKERLIVCKNKKKIKKERNQTPSLRYPCRKALPWLWEAVPEPQREGEWKLTYCSPFICMKLFTPFHAVLFLLSLSPTASFLCTPSPFSNLISVCLLLQQTWIEASNYKLDVKCTPQCT